MAEHIDGPLYYERMGRTGPVMAFVHPKSDGPVVLDLPDGAHVHLVPLHRHRHSRLRPLAEGAAPA